MSVNIERPCAVVGSFCFKRVGRISKFSVTVHILTVGHVRPSVGSCSRVGILPCAVKSTESSIKVAGIMTDYFGADVSKAQEKAQQDEIKFVHKHVSLINIIMY